MGELVRRRALKKEATRTLVRDTAQALFAERGFDAVTVADIAAAAAVAVQTVFNHFPTKEELYFADRTPWVVGPADAVRDRPAGTSPLAALDAYGQERVGAHIEALRHGQLQGFWDVVDSSPALRAHELRLHHEAVVRLREELVEAWRQDSTQAPAGDPLVAASVLAAGWLAAVRAVVREEPYARADVPAERSTAALGQAHHVLTDLASLLAGHPADPVRRAG
ncbi:TetR/AcrR family transcriptional regulator [Blastococcus sp. SYSU D00820]